MTAEMAAEANAGSVGASTWFRALAQLPGYGAPGPGLPNGVVSATHQWATAYLGETTESYVVCPQRNTAAAYRHFFAPRFPRARAVPHDRLIRGVLFSICALSVLGLLIAISPY